MKKMTLAEIIEKEQSNRHEDGMFGIKACKETIMWSVRIMKTDLFSLLKEYLERANTDIFFNRAMVLACWEMINEN